MNTKSKNSNCSIYKSIDLFLIRRSETLRRAFAQFIITLRGAGGEGIFGRNAPRDMNGNVLAGTSTTNTTTSVRNVPLWEIGM